MGRYGQSSTLARQPDRPPPKAAPAARAPTPPARSAPQPVRPAERPLLDRPIFGSGYKSIGRADAAGIAMQLGIMLDACVPLTQAIESLQSQAIRPHVRDALQLVLADLRNGSDLSAAVARCPYRFPAIFSRLLRAAEASGAMGPTLVRVSEYLQAEMDTVHRLRAALAYPAAMIALAVAATGLIFGFLLPRFEMLYTGRQSMLPLPTKVALAISHFMRDYWMPLTGGGIMLVVGLVLYLRCEHGRATLDWLKLHCPLIHRMFRQFYLTRTFQTVGAMVAAGVTVPEAVRLSRDVAGNRYFAELWDIADASLQSGQRLADPLFASDLVSNTVAQMVATGERSGNLPLVMQQVALLADRELQHTIKTVTSLLEPILIVVLGGFVGGIAMAILLPVFRITRIMGGG